jgi:hypothetical protein
MSDRRFSYTNPEHLWDALLSRQPDLIRSAFTSLDASDQTKALAHLRRMATEEGWHPEQRQSALAAMAALAEDS